MSSTSTRQYLLHRHALATNASPPPLAGGVRLTCENPTALSAYRWPTHAAVPWRRGSLRGRYFRLGIFEDGVEIPSHEVDAQTWDRYGVDLRWSHLHFVSTQGKTYSVRALSRRTRRPAPRRPLSIVDGASSITVESGWFKAVFGKTAFALFDELHFDPLGRGNYARPLLHGSRGPEIMDAGELLAARFDAQVRVTVEVQSPVYAVVKAEGSYRNATQTDPGWAAFSTRIHVWAGAEWIRVVHNLGYRGDMSAHAYDRAAVVLPFGFGERFAFAADAAAAAHKGDFDRGKDVYLHQEKHDAYRFGTDRELRAGTPRAIGARSGNAWAVQGSRARARVECYLRNGWQEFPFEARVGPAEVGVSMQPWHGRETFGPLSGPDHVGEHEIHKLRYAHSGPQQRQGLPAEYVTLFNAIDAARIDRETGETSATAAASANWQGMMLRQELFLRLRRDDTTALAKLDTSDLLEFATLVQHRPIYVSDPSHVQDSFVFGPIGTVDDGYREVFDHVSDVIKGDYNPERGEYYGRFRWGAMPHYWHATLDRPNWHRLEYGDSHYDRIALIFWYFLATGDAGLLQLARKAVKFHQCMRYVNYPSSIVNHSFMAQWHKSLAPCGGVTNDDAVHASGHSVHAYSMLVGWLVDADRDLLDGYTRWARRPGHYTISNRDRETNNMLHEAIQEYEFFHERDIKMTVREIGKMLISAPMITPVRNDRVWDRAWPLYLDLFGGPGVRAFFQAETVPGQWLHDDSGFGSLSLCYRITGDAAFLRRGLQSLRSRVLRSIFRSSGGRYSPAFFQDIYSRPELHKTLLHYLYYLKQAGITDIPEVDGEPGQYPVGSATATSIGDVVFRGLWIAILNPSGQPFRLQLRLASVGGGDLDSVGVSFLSPQGTELLPQLPRFDQVNGVQRERESGWSEFLREVPIPAQPAGGRYDLFLGSHEAGQFLPTTAERLPECAVIRNATTANVVAPRRYHATLTRMVVVPLTSHTIDWTFRPWSPDNGCRIRVVDGAGQAILDAYLMRNEPGNEYVTVRMNGVGDPPPPWQIDCGTVYEVEASSQGAYNSGVSNLALLGAEASVLDTMKPLIPLSGR